MINPDAPFPIYIQLANLLRAQISSGALRAESKIASENQLAKHYQIGRPTVRQATDLLVREGLLQRRRGSGTFVLPAPKRVDLFSLAGTHRALSDSALDSEIQIIESAQLLAADQYHPSCMQGREVYRLQRLSSLGGAASVYEYLYLDAALFPKLEQQPIVGGSISQLLREVYFLEPKRATQSFAVVLADPYIAEHLGLETATPLLKVQRSLDFALADAAVYSDIYCRSDRVNFSQTIELAHPRLDTMR